MCISIGRITAGSDLRDHERSGWIAVVEWGRLKQEWLRRFLPFANGIASHDTFGRVFALLDAEIFEACFIRWMQALCPMLVDRHIAIDGKSVRGSHDGAQGMVHLVSAWSSDAGLTLGQVKTADKSNEITAIPELLKALDIKGATITIDAMGCQHAIVDQIVAQQGHYVIAVKDNQPSLAEAIRQWFAAAEAGTMDRPFWQDAAAVEKDHGRLETRRCVVTNDVAWLRDMGQDWTGIQSLVMVESTREMVNGKNKGQRSTEQRYYISDLPAKPALLNRMIRAHWGIENNMHWVLDVAFDEDDCRIRVGDGAQNFAILRRIALNRFKQDRSTKLGIANKRLKAAWDINYLAALLHL